MQNELPQWIMEKFEEKWSLENSRSSALQGAIWVFNLLRDELFPLTKKIEDPLANARAQGEPSYEQLRCDLDFHRGLVAGYKSRLRSMGVEP